VFCACTEDTRQVLSDRRLRTLRELAATAEAKTVEDACAISVRILGQNPQDVPFALLYLLDADQTVATLAGATGIEIGTAASPSQIALNETQDSLLRSVLSSGKLQVIRPSASYGILPGEAWTEQVTQVSVLPLAASGQTQLAGFLVAGISPRREFDDDYRGFFDLMAGQISTAIANAHAYEAERKRAEALAELDRAKTTFFSNVSHEFRTPLTLMLSPLEDAIASLGSTIPLYQREQLQLVQRNGLRLLKLVNTLLDFSRIEAGRVQAVYEPTDLSAFTIELASVFRSAIERAQLRLVIDCPTLPEPVYVDPEMWEKIIFNLLSNAFKFTFEGTITVRLQWKTDHVELAVCDTGIGIPVAEVPHLFERFHRVQGAQGRSIEGSGIGLSLVQELVKLHCGTIKVISVEGTGTCFKIAIPTGSAHLPQERISAGRSLVSTGLGANPYLEEALRWLPETDMNLPIADFGLEESPTEHTKLESPSSKILLADDNADMRAYVKRLLSQQYEVEAVADGLAALVAIQRQVPDLVLTDVMMPNLDGFGLLRSLRTQPATQEIPIILLSARAGEEARVEGLAAGADDYLVKPFSARELLARVEASLKLARSRREATIALSALLAAEQQARAAAETAQAEAQTANRIKDEFLAVLSHELRSPLNPILGWTKLLQGGKLTEARASEALITIDRNAQLQAQLIDDLLDISRILRGKLTLHAAPVDLRFVISAALETVRLAAESKQIQIHLSLTSQMVRVMGDTGRLQQVVWNLLSNAVKFTPTGGKVEVHLTQTELDAQIQVIDTGKGINPDFLPYVFEHFRQEDGATTRKFGGLGLGLAIVRQIVEMHGGRVSVESAGENQGATFTVQIPLIRTVVDALPDPSPSTAASHPMPLAMVRALVVDDDPDNGNFVGFLLEESGAIVTVTTSALEALQVLEQQHFDILLSDVGMPDMDGYMLIQQIRAQTDQPSAKIPAIALTAYAGELDQQQAIAAGFQHHLAKPVNPDTVISLITQLLQSAEIQTFQQ
jgi:signal transduction histidine kinase